MSATECLPQLSLGNGQDFLKRGPPHPLPHPDPEDEVVMKDEEVKGSGPDLTLKELSNSLADFARVRNWEQFHSPRNLLLALVGEVGELSEIFQWKGEVAKGLPDWDSNDKEHLGEELSDVLMYLVRLADICGIDLVQATLSKLEKNNTRFPINKR